MRSHVEISKLTTFDKYIGFLIVESGPSGPGVYVWALNFISKQSMSHGMTFTELVIDIQETNTKGSLD